MKKQINDLLLKMQNGENCIGETANQLLDLFAVSGQAFSSNFNQIYIYIYMSNNITPKQKAIELADKHYSISGITRFSKAYALITVNEIIEALVGCHTEEEYVNYWFNVKSEIEKL